MHVAYAPVAPQIAERQEELHHVLDVLRPRAIVLFDSNAAKSLREQHRGLASLANIPIKINFGVEEFSSQEGWISIDDLGAAAERDNGQTTLLSDLDDSKDNPDEPALILLTSGTTSLPKACPHTAKSLTAQTQVYETSRGIDCESKVLASGPTFHILAIWNILMAWRAGASVIFPSPRFEVGAMVDCLNTIKCTHMAVTPSMALSLASHPSFSKSGYPSLKTFATGGDGVSVDSVKRYSKLFRAAKTLNGWGMTEATGLVSTPYQETQAWKNGAVSIGRAMPGTSIRVCKPHTQEAVARGETGELHISGAGIVPGYLSKKSIARNDSFYYLSEAWWFKTGDAVMMNDAGEIFVTSRYKDLIIRGGENLSPAKIQECLNTLDGVEVSKFRPRLIAVLTLHKSQVFGIEDSFMGQLPVAVLRLTNFSEHTDMVKNKAQSCVVNRLGPTFRLASVWTLAELRLQHYPTTSTGKIRMSVLRDAVCRLIPERATPSEVKRGPTASALIKLWQRVLGTGSESIRDSTRVSEMADSLAMLRFCFQVEQEFNMRLEIYDLRDHGTPAAQATLLDERSQIGSDAASHNISVPQENDQSNMLLSADPEALAESRTKIAAKCLASLNVNWPGDVEAIYRPHDSLAIFATLTTRPASDNVRWIFRPKDDLSAEEIRSALAKCLANHASLRSVVVPFENNTTTPRTIHVVPKLTETWLNKMVSQSLPVDDPKELASTVLDPLRPYGKAGEPSLQVQIIPVQGSSRPGILFSAYHTVFDAFSFGGFLQELEAILSKSSSKRPSRVPYGVFADMYQLHKGSAPAQISRAYQQSKLGQLEGAEACLWPRLRGPGVMSGDDYGWKYPDGSPGRPEERVSLAEAEGKPRGVSIKQQVDVPGLPLLKTEHKMEASAVAKAAVAIFNVEQTGQKQAIFGNPEAGRVWPFMEPWISQHLPNTLKIAGPCMGRGVNFINIDGSESVGDLLTRVGAEQRLNTIHCHAPWESIMEELGSRGDLLRDIILRQLFNWDSSTQSRAQTEAKFWECLNRAATLDRGFMWNFGLVNSERLAAFAVYDDVHLSPSEVEAALGRVCEIIKCLSEPRNWQESVAKVLRRI